MTDRFPPDVTAVLTGGYWKPDPVRDPIIGNAVIEIIRAVKGERHSHVPFPAAYAAAASLPTVSTSRVGPGEYRWVRYFTSAGATLAHNADILADLSAVIGARLFPIGTEDIGDTFVAIDEQGRVFVLDQAGEWFVADNLDAAIINMVRGGQVFRVRDDGTW